MNRPNGPEAGIDAKPVSRRRLAFRLLVPALVLAVAPVVSQAKTKTVKAIQAEIPQDAVLDVGVQLLDPGLGDGDAERLEQRGIFPELRKSEACFIPVQLRNTLEATGNWGAVRVVPAGDTLSEVTVEGRILHSTGTKLALAIRASDAAGRVWFDRKYEAKADARVYEEEELQGARDPFQNLYNKIANHMLAARKKLRDRHVATVREVSRLRFAAHLAPDLYDGYLERDRKGRYEIDRLPAEDEPMMARIGRIRASDEFFIDTLDEHFALFHTRMDEPYDHWRAESYEQQQTIRKLQRKSLLSKVVGGVLAAGSLALMIRAEEKERDDEESDSGAVEEALANAAAIGAQIAIQHGIALGQENKLYRMDLHELAASLDAEVEPMLLEADGRTLRLTGSKQAQFAEWRALLRRMWQNETGLAGVPDVGAVMAEAR